MVQLNLWHTPIYFEKHMPYVFRFLYTSRPMMMMGPCTNANGCARYVYVRQTQRTNIVILIIIVVIARERLRVSEFCALDQVRLRPRVEH